MAKIKESAKKRAASFFSETCIDQTFNAFMNQSDPDMVLQAVGKSRRDLRGLDTDDEISAAMDTRKDACLSAPWKLETMPGINDDFIMSELTTWISNIISVAFNALPFGYSVAELIYEKKADGLIGLKAVAEKPFEWFEPRNDGTLVWLTKYGTREEMDTQFKILFTQRNATYRNPFGEALYSRLYWAWFFRHNTWLFWMRFLERFSNPLILGKTHDTEGMVAALRGMGIDSVIAVQTDEDVKAILANSAGEFERVETALAKRIQKSILGQTLTSDVQGGGSFAASKTHNEVRHDKRNSDLRMISPAISQVVKALWTINGFEGKEPVFSFKDEAHIDKERADRDAVLVNAGICKLSDDYIMRVYDFKDGDLLPNVVTAPVIPTQKTFNKTFSVIPDNLPDDIIAARLAKESAPVTDSWIDTVKGHVSSATSLEQLRDTILDAYPDMDLAALADVMMQQQMIANCIGRLEVQSEITGISAIGEL